MKPKTTDPTPRARLNALLAITGPALTQRGLAALAGVPHSYPNRVAVGDVVKANRVYMGKIAKVFGVSTAWIMGDEEAEPSPVAVLASVAEYDARHRAEVSRKRDAVKTVQP